MSPIQAPRRLQWIHETIKGRSTDDCPAEAASIIACCDKSLRESDAANHYIEAKRFIIMLSSESQPVKIQLKNHQRASSKIV
jgi:hypothetical protein